MVGSIGSVDTARVGDRSNRFNRMQAAATTIQRRRWRLHCRILFRNRWRHENGRPTGKTYRLQPGDNERVIAARLALEAWRATARGSSFNRELAYEKCGVA